MWTIYIWIFKLLLCRIDSILVDIFTFLLLTGVRLKSESKSFFFYWYKIGNVAPLAAVQINFLANTTIQELNLQNENMFVAWQPIIPIRSLIQFSLNSWISSIAILGLSLQPWFWIRSDMLNCFDWFLIIKKNKSMSGD